jgi:SnoaL-like domain
MMNKISQPLFRTLAVGILFSFLLASCASAKPSDPVSVVQAAFDRLNMGDLDGMMELYSEEAVMCSPGGCFHGAQEIRDKLTSYMTLRRRIELSNLSSDGNVVTFYFKSYQGNFLAEDVPDGLDVVVDGRIIFDGSKADLRIECDRDPSQAFCPED